MPAKSPTKKSSDYVELRVPKINIKNLKNKNFLTLLIIIMTFALGMLTMRVITLEEKVKQASTMENLQAQETAEAAPPPQFVEIDEGQLPIQGDKNASVTIVEFSDFECPFCKAFFDDAYPEIKEKYIDTGKVKFSYRHFPLSSIHPNAQIAAEASECANEQDKFWEYHDILFNNQSSWASLTGDLLNSTLADYAGQAGMDTTKFSSCLASGKYADQVAEDLSAGSAAGVDGTPAFFINGQRMVGAQPFSEFERVIEEELQK